MGGGSSDAAASLLLANQLWKLGRSRAQLSEVASEIGSDVPFFLHDGPAICTGRGEVVEPIAPLPPLHFIVVKPPVGLGTANVYRALADGHESSLAECRPRIDALIEHARRGDWQNVGRWMVNRLESAAATLCPWIGRLRHLFHNFDVAGHQLTGSGTAYFGLCRSGRQARRLAGMLRSQRIGYVYPVFSCP
jgi:4-diphosphocytidyl-2-C-methyl-D-erythritol kinase